MFKNYFKTALRNFRKNKVTTFINVLGLSIGISAALIIFMVVEYDYSFDKYEPDRDRIYRLVTEGEQWKNSGVPVPFHEAIQQKVSGIQTTALLLQYNDWHIKAAVPQGNNKPPKIFKAEDAVVFADSNYFSIFPQQWIAGNATSSLQSPYQLVITESKAQQYFPGLPPAQVIGKTVVFSDTINTTITGIVKDLKQNSDFKYKAFISLSTVPLSNLKSAYSWDEWGNTNSNFQTFVKLSPGTNPLHINKQLAPIFKEHATADDNKTIHRLQPLSDIHTNPDFDGSVDPSTIRNLILLAVFLLLLGAINFINLSTAHAAERAKEIGIRKTLGSKKSQLILQFLAETFLLTAFTAIVSVAISPLLLKAFSGFIPDGLKFNYFLSQPVVYGFLLLLILTVSVIAGLYPAFILTRFKPVSVLKNRVVSAGGSTRSAWLRKSLIVFQFVIAQVFIIAMFVVDKQIHFSLAKDMGFRKDAIINFYVPFDFQNPGNKKFVLKDALTKIPGIQEASIGNQSPAFIGQISTQVVYKSKNKDLQLDVDSRNGDTGFLSVYNIPLVAGRNISPSDSATEFLINETLARQLGFQQPRDAIGHFLTFRNSQKPIVGVMKDFNLASVRSVIHPMVYYAAPKRGYVMHIALQNNPATWNKTIDKIQAAWKAIYPDVDFDYSFLDKKIEEFYKNDQQLSTLLTWSAAITILISCLGLLGLVIFMTNSRVKEIGVRKVLGASVAQIIQLLSVDFVKLLLIAFVIAIPIAWWQTHNWLQDFAYHTTLSWWIFLLSGVIMIIIAVAILCIRAGKAAMANPVKALRTE
ncbi:ABC transporter permease [Parafilimonas sp.]|uniref:ABC transporter permease n=1 Tax=Parafilimonas sp. TaxID=1969739 RepID=UPI0039E2D6CA